VLHLRTITGRGGGPEKTILNSPRSIGPGYDMCLVYFRPRYDPEFDMVERARRLGVQLVDIAETGPCDLRALRQLTGLLRQYRPHVIHAHDYKTNVLALLLGRFFRTRVMTTLHGNVERTRRLNTYYQTDRLTLPRMDHVVAVSRDLHERALQLGVAAGRCTLIHNAIDHQQFRRSCSPAEARGRLGLDPRRLLVGSIGRLSAEKGFDVLIRSFAQVRQAIPQAQLVLVGQGNQRAELERLVCDSGLGDAVRLAGHQTDVAAWLEAMDVFALASLREGLPNVLLEAMAMTVPIVATDVGGIDLLVADGTTGRLVPPSDEGALTEAIGQLLAEEPLRKRLSSAARELIEREYSFERRMASMRAIYDGLLTDRDG
jgi:glycosyltransferase involved in cell wall biosynthesis